MTIDRKSFALALLLIAVFNLADCSHWSYAKQNNWSGYCKTGKNQSPINIEAGAKKSFPPFIFNNFDRNFNAIAKNNGHSVELRITDDIDNVNTSGGGLPTQYKVDHIHFHWPSEHKIRGKRYPLEMHVVHYSAKYKTLADAIDKQHGIAVLGVLFEVSPDDDVAFQPLTDVLAKVAAATGSSETVSIDLRAFLPRDTAGFYRYEGSLTTPGCNEGLIWTVFTETIHLSRAQIKLFESTKLDDTSSTNYRHVQNKNGRIVYWKQSPSIGARASSYPLLSTTIVLLSATLFY